MQSSHSDFGQAGYSQQYGYPPTLQSVPPNSGHDMSKQVPTGQPGMYSNSSGIPSAPQHHHQGGMAVPVPSQQNPMVQSGQQLSRQHMQRFYAQNNVPRTVQSLGRNPMSSVVNQQPQQASSQFGHAMPIVQSHPLHTIGPLLVNPQLTPVYQPQRPFPSQYSIIGPPNQHLYYSNFMSTQNNYAPPQNANGYFQPHQMQSYNTMPSQIPQMPPQTTSQPTGKKRLAIINPDTGKDIFDAVNEEAPKENEQDADICIQFATQVAQAIANDEKSDPKSVSADGPPITQQSVVLCPDNLETENSVVLESNSGDSCEQYIDPNEIDTTETLTYCNKDSDLPIVNDTYENKCVLEQLNKLPEVEIPDTQVPDVVSEESISEIKEKDTDNLLPVEEFEIEKSEVFYVQDSVQIQPSAPLVTEISTNRSAQDLSPIVSQPNLPAEDNKIVLSNVDIQESSANNLKAQEKQPAESKKNKAKKKKDLNKRGESKEGGDMDAFLDRSEEVSSKLPPIAPASPPAVPVSPITPVSPAVEQRPESPPIPTIVDTEILSTIPLPGETVESLPNDISPIEQQQEEVNSVSPSAEMEDKENVDQDGQSKNKLLKYTYKEDQWSPLNPEGKKQYDRDFLLQLQSQPMSLCKPTNLPNLDVIKDKAYIQKLTEVNNRAAPLPVSLRAYDPFVPNFCARSGSPRLPHPPLGRRSQQGRGEKKTQKIINLPSSQSIKLHESENAWKPSVVKPRAGNDSVETQELYKRVRGILNKLTPQKFETLVEQVKNFDINTEEKLKGVIDLVFEKAIDEPNFSVPYANMCKQLALVKVPLEGHPDQDVNFRKLLLTKCQKEFEQDTRDELNREEKLQAIQAAEDPVRKKELKMEFDEEAKKMRYRQLGNIRFIGELFKLTMLIEPIMHECIKKLLHQRDEESLECLCKLLKTIGKELEEKGDKNSPRSTLMEQYFAQMQKIVEGRLTSSRVRFMLQDVIDLRKNNWVPRRDENNPKTIDQIHKEAEKEAREQQQQVYSNMSYPKRMPDDRRKTSGRNMGVSEDGWTPSSKSNKGGYILDPSKLKLTKPDEVDSIRLGPCGRGISWGRGSSGGNKAPTEAENKTAIANRYSALADQSMTTQGYENRRGSQRSAASSRESSRGRNSQALPAAIRKTPSSSRERENLIETVKELNRTVPQPEPKPQEIKKHNDSHLNGKTVENTVMVLKGPDYSEGEIDKKTKPLIDEFLHNADFEEAIKCVMELVSPTTVNYFIYYAINQVLERSSQTRSLLGQLFYTLVKKELITLDQFKKGLSGVLENMDDYALDIPLIWEYMGELLEPMIEENKLPMSFLKEALEPVLPSITAGKLVSAVLHCAAKKKGTIKLGELWRESGLQWTDFLGPSADITEFISSHSLDFTVSPTKVVSNTDLSTDEIRTQLKSLLDNTKLEDNEKIFDWIDARVPPNAITEPSFIRALATAVHESAIIGNGSKCELNADILKKRIPLLTRYIDHNDSLELQALYAIQRLVTDLGQPKGVLRQIFDILYDDDVITEETFKQWENSTDPNESEGKSVALLCVRGFFTWLRESESGEDNEIGGE